MADRQGDGGNQGVGGQMLELGHPQVGDGDEVLHGAEASGCCFGLLQQPVHRLDVSIAVPIEHAAQHAIEAISQGLGQALEDADIHIRNEGTLDEFSGEVHSLLDRIGSEP